MSVLEMWFAIFPSLNKKVSKQKGADQVRCDQVRLPRRYVSGGNDWKKEISTHLHHY